MEFRPRHALILAALAFAGVASGAQGIPPTAAEKELATAQRELDATAARLARARTGLRLATGPERRRLERREVVLARRKAGLTRRVAGLAAEALDSVRAERDVWVVIDEGPQEIEIEAEAGAGLSAGGSFVADGVRLHSAPDGPAGPPIAPGGGAVDAIALDAYLAARTSPLAGLGPTFVAEASAVGLDPRLLVAITGAETSFGTYAPSQAIHNPFGLGPGRTYPSWAESIRTAARTLAGPIYLGDGRVTIPAIQARWAPSGASNDPTGLNNNWVRNVGVYYRELGGDPDAPVFAGSAVPLAAPANTALGPVGGPGARMATAAARHLGEPAGDEGSGDSVVTPRELVRLAAEEAGVPLDTDPAAAGRPVERQDRRAGDILVLSRPGSTEPHVGVYLGAGAFVHASEARGEVSLATLHESRFAGRLVGIRRVTP